MEDTRSIAGDLGGQFQTLYQFEKHDAATVGAAPFAVVPEGKELQSLKPFIDENREKPIRRRGSSSIRDIESFLAIVERFSGVDSAVFADPNRERPTVTAIFDYHPLSSKPTDAEWLGHRAVYAPQLSDEWRAWMKHNNQWMPQADFAAFIEERATELCVPNLDDPKLKTFAQLVDGRWATPGDMIALSRGLQINVTATVKNAQTLNTGEVSIVYDEQHRDGSGQPLKIATLFRIVIPVFYAGAPYYLSVRLRYRQDGPTIKWLYQIVRPDLVFDDAFNGKPDPAAPSIDENLSIVERVRKVTHLPVFLGTPEAQ